jgi:hypothetical protein
MSHLRFALAAFLLWVLLPSLAMAQVVRGSIGGPPSNLPATVTVPPLPSGTPPVNLTPGTNPVSAPPTTPILGSPPVNLIPGINPVGAPPTIAGVAVLSAIPRVNPLPPTTPVGPPITGTAGSNPVGAPPITPVLGVPPSNVTPGTNPVGAPPLVPVVGAPPVTLPGGVVTLVPGVNPFLEPMKVPH